MTRLLARLLSKIGERKIGPFRFGGMRKIFRRPGEDYLDRYYILRIGGKKTTFFGLFLHYFHVSDYPVPHDHPWNLLSIPLGGGYLEHMMDGSVIDRGTWRHWIKFRTAEEFHWVDLKPSTNGPDFRSEGGWSVFFHFRKRKTWGFWTKNEGWVAHNEYDPVTESRLK